LAPRNGFICRSVYVAEPQRPKLALQSQSRPSRPRTSGSRFFAPTRSVSRPFALLSTRNGAPSVSESPKPCRNTQGERGRATAGVPGASLSRRRFLGVGHWATRRAFNNVPCVHVRWRMRGEADQAAPQACWDAAKKSQIRAAQQDAGCRLRLQAAAGASCRPGGRQEA
jgi:hypothetical protein